MRRSVTMFSTRWCGHCRRLQRQLAEARIDASVIDIDDERHSHHGDRIIAWTGGNRTVPTVEVDGRLLVNPTVGEVEAALAELPEG